MILSRRHFVLGSLAAAAGCRQSPTTKPRTAGAPTPQRQPEQAKARDAWLRFSRDQQLTEQHGWAPADREYGGWGYCHGLPLKPKPGAMAPPMTESNLSATTFALAAFKAAGVPA